jgi:hypothetical protein
MQHQWLATGDALELVNTIRFLDRDHWDAVCLMSNRLNRLKQGRLLLLRLLLYLLLGMLLL